MRKQEIVECACGCGETLERYDSQWRERKYISGHNLNGKPRPMQNPEIAKRVAEKLKGRVRTEEHCKNLSAARKGHVRSIESRIKQSESLKGEGNPQYGKRQELSVNWKGGTYGYWHDKAAELFMKERCEHCGMTNEEHLQIQGRGLAMHNTLMPKDYTVMEPSAWMTLCNSCHITLENHLRLVQI